MTGFWLGTVASSSSSVAAEASFDDLFQFDRTEEKQLTLAPASTPIYSTAMFFKSDGTKVFFVCANGASDYSTGERSIKEYGLSTAWDISTATHTTTFNTTDILRDVYIDSAGTTLFALDFGSDILKYSLSTAWDLSTISTQISATDFNPGGGNHSPQGLWFKSDGSKVYISDRSNEQFINSVNYRRAITSWSLSTAWDLSTAGSMEIISIQDLIGSFSGGETTNMRSLRVVDDGATVVIADDTSGVKGFTQLDLSTAYDTTTASFSKRFNSTLTSIQGIGLSEGNLNKLYLLASNTSGDEVVYQYNKEYDVPTIILSDSITTADSISSPSFPQGFSYESSVTSQALNGSTISTLTLSLSTASVGDLCVLWDHRRNEESTSVPTSNTPSGWTLIGTSSGNYANEFRSDYLYKVLTSSDITNGVTGGEAEDRYMRAYIFSYGTISTVTARDFTTQSTTGDQSLQTQNISTLSSSAPVVCFGFKMTYGGTQTASFVEPTWGTEFTSSSLGNGALASGFTIQNDTLSDINVDANDQGNAQELTSFHLEIS